ncbi:Inositol hexakisphosphate kinase 1 [Eumeta japonica]|uniref:Inositol hexakisphosphate kinase 1 n=1 Tax=Eumeta variegata TaxID=151549 RepID=A0A4C1V5F3_EUMVA|nr:Inositol hexakisphosphate kinase 1 [Eumeta japonica]
MGREWAIGSTWRVRVRDVKLVRDWTVAVDAYFRFRKSVAPARAPLYARRWGRRPRVQTTGFAVAHKIVAKLFQTGLVRFEVYLLLQKRNVSSNAPAPVWSGRKIKKTPSVSGQLPRAQAYEGRPIAAARDFTCRAVSRDEIACSCEFSHGSRRPRHINRWDEVRSLVDAVQTLCSNRRSDTGRRRWRPITRVFICLVTWCGVSEPVDVSGLTTTALRLQVDSGGGGSAEVMVYSLGWGMGEPERRGAGADRKRPQPPAHPAAAPPLAPAASLADDGHEVDVLPLHNQVGGHTRLLVLNDSTVIKPLNIRELHFYQNIPDDIQNFVPRYKGERACAPRGGRRVFFFYSSPLIAIHLI